MMPVEIAEVVDCAGWPYNMEDEPSRHKLIAWKETLEQMLEAVNWIAVDSGLDIPESPRLAVQRIIAERESQGL